MLDATPATSAPAQKTRTDSSAIRSAVDLLGHAGGAGMKCALVGVLFASAEDEGERADYAAEFLVERQEYIDAIDRKATVAPFLEDIKEIVSDRRAVYSFYKRLKEMSGRKVDMDLAAARDLAVEARRNLQPALVRMTNVLEERLRAEADAEHSHMSEKAALVDGMLGDMGRIGRMIGLISINASVEAAHAGGESGRAFQVIAEEVRDLARQSSQLLEQTKARLAEDSKVVRRAS